MKTLRKSIAPALLLAIVMAATILVASEFPKYEGLRGYPAKAVIFYAFTLLLYGWPECLALAGAHHWLLRRYAGLRAPGYAAVLGAGLALAIWGLAVLFNPNASAELRRGHGVYYASLRRGRVWLRKRISISALSAASHPYAGQPGLGFFQGLKHRF